MFTKIGRIGLFEGRLICALDGIGGFFFEDQALESSDGRRVGEVLKSKSGRALNMHVGGRTFTAGWGDLLRVVQNGGKAVVFEVV